MKCFCATFFFFSLTSISVQKVSEFTPSWRSQGRAVVLLSEEETNLALNSRGITPKRRSAYWKQGPIVISVIQEGWRTRRSCEVIGSWRSGRGRPRWGTPCEGYSGLHYGASTEAPRSPSTNACSPWIPSGGIPAALFALLTAVCNTATQQTS